jgi:enoyl-CoA hydratase/carnithine racemase
MTKALLNQELHMDMTTAFDAEGQIQAACMQSHNFREAYLAFKEKRKTRFV